MQRPFANKRPIGPFIIRSNQTVSSPMSNTEQGDSVCSDILERKESLIRNMISDTSSSGREQVVILVEVDDKLLATDVEQGKEGSITRSTIANLSMDSTMLAINERGGGKLDPTTVKEYEIHTHPEGHIDFSTRDLTSIGNNMSEEMTKNIPDGHFVAVKGDDEILLHGLYRTREITGEEASKIKSVSNTVEAMDSLSITKSQKQRRVIDELTSSGYETCASRVEY